MSLLKVVVAPDEAGSLGVELDGDGTVVGFAYRGCSAEVAGVLIGSRIVTVNMEPVWGKGAIAAAVEAAAPGPYELEIRPAGAPDGYGGPPPLPAGYAQPHDAGAGERSGGPPPLPPSPPPSDGDGGHSRRGHEHHPGTDTSGFPGSYAQQLRLLQEQQEQLLDLVERQARGGGGGGAGRRSVMHGEWWNPSRPQAEAPLAFAPLQPEPEPERIDAAAAGRASWQRGSARPVASAGRRYNGASSSDDDSDSGSGSDVAWASRSRRGRSRQQPAEARQPVIALRNSSDRGGRGARRQQAWLDGGASSSHSGGRSRAGHRHHRGGGSSARRPSPSGRRQHTHTQGRHREHHVPEVGSPESLLGESSPDSAVLARRARREERTRGHEYSAASLRCVAVAPSSSFLCHVFLTLLHLFLGFLHGGAHIAV